MAVWNIGIDDVSEQTQAFKDKLSSKDSHIAAQDNQLLRQTAELEELKNTLNDAIHKLSREAKRTLQLESDLHQRTEDLRNEKIASQNIQTALNAANDKIKAKDLEARELEAILDSVSHTSDGHNLQSNKLQKEKATLELRVRELETNLQNITCRPTTPGRRTFTRPRSSSLSDFKITTLEQELAGIHVSLAQKDTDLQTANQRLSQAQRELTRIDNEKSAMEKRMAANAALLQASLEEKDEELSYMRDQQGDNSREEELLKRIEEDDAKISALEMMLRDVQDVKEVTGRLRRAEERLDEERKKVVGAEELHAELVKEKEEALDQLEVARSELAKLPDAVGGNGADDTRSMRQNRSQNSHTTSSADVPFLNPLLEEPLLPSPPPKAVPDGEAIAYIERLLAAIDRLRMERDNLRRDVQFLESESKFTIEALEAKLSASASASPSSTTNESLATIGQLKAEMDDLHIQLAQVTERNKATMHAKNKEIRRLGLTATAVAIVVGRIQSRVNSGESHLNDAAECQAKASADAEDKLQEAEDKLDITVLCLEAMTSQRDDLMLQLESKEDELERTRTSREETLENLDNVEQQLLEGAKQLEEAESERDSLKLQVTNLIADLTTAQEELENAESRYSSLQFHQLSSMSSNEATRALREQIEELEMRVLRRTEQIGIHQHDIKRLETNLRLQEERLSEMTIELETLAAQKDAMVEDCADAREARDEALARAENLEEEVENLESKLLQSDDATEGMVRLVFQTISRARQAVRQSNEQACAANDAFESADAEVQTTKRLLDGKSFALTDAHIQLESLVDDIRQTTLAFAVSQVALKRSSVMGRSLRDDKADLQSNILVLEEQLEEQRARGMTLTEELEAISQNSSKHALEKAARVSELEDEVAALRKVSSATGIAHQEALDGLQRSIAELQHNLDEKERLASSSGDVEKEIAQLKSQHADKLGALQARLTETSLTLGELRVQHASVEEDYQQTISDLEQSKQELEGQLKIAKEQSLNNNELQNTIDVIRKEHSEKIARLQDALDEATREIEEAHQSRDELQAAQRDLLQEIAQVTQAHETAVHRIQEQSLAMQRSLEFDLSDLQVRFEEKCGGLQESMEEARRVSEALQEELTKRTTDQQKHAAELQSVQEQLMQAEASASGYEQDIYVLRSKLDQSEHYLQSTDKEKTALQEHITTLEAEIQRSLSLKRFLENQVRDSEHTISSLSQDLERIHTELARSEKSAKAAEVNLSLQSAQHKREMADLQRELSALRSMRSLEQVIADLEERNNEMEDLLRAKCSEIEENDDRALEMLKENKKLTTKVESLTRKVQNLQTKLATAKAIFPKAREEISPVAASTSSTMQHNSTPSTERSRSVTLSSTSSTTFNPVSVPSATTYRAPSARVASSSLPRPKTPERRIVPSPVFKARTPDRPFAPSTDDTPSSTMIGKKRRAPDDFEVCESVPPQAFTADSLPRDEAENKTPRVRRVLSSFQSGFTPIRHQSSRPFISLSPKRAASSSASARSSPFISDVTNAPSSAKPSKRSWLGKIRGVASQPVGRPVSSVPTFQRPEDDS